MKIAFIVSSFPCLSETFILSQVTGLIDRGHNVRVLSNNNPQEAVVHPDFKKYVLKKRTRYFSTPKKNKFEMRLSFVVKFFKCFCVSPFRTVNVFIYLLRQKGGFSYTKFNYMAPFLIRSDEVVHCHFGTIGHVGILLKKTNLCRHLIVTFYGYDVSSYVKKNGKDCYYELFKISDKLLVLSQDMKRKLIELGADENKIQIHHLGAKPNRFEYKERQLPPDRPVRILSVARLSEKKGLQYSIQAVSRMIQVGPSPSIEYLIAGEGELRDDLERLISDLNMQKYILLLGAKDQQEIRELFNQSDIFLLSSVTAKDGDQEGTPTVLTEAICCGIPVVSTLHAGIPDIIIDGESGYLVPERDVDALQGKLSYLIEHPETWAQMGRKGRQHFDQEFDVDMLNKKLEDVYSQILH